MASYLHRYPAPAHPGKLLRNGFLGRRHAAFPLLIVTSQHAIAAGFVSQVHADRDQPFFTTCCSLRTLRDGAILLHGRSPLHFECVSIGSLTHPARRSALSFHLSIDVLNGAATGGSGSNNLAATGH